MCFTNLADFKREFDTMPDKLCLSKESNSFNSSSAFALLSIFFSDVLINSSENGMLLTICSFI